MNQESTAYDLKTLSLNCRGLTNSIKRKTVFRFIEDKNIDIAFLQETFITKTSVDEFDQSWGGRAYHCLSDSNHSRGVCILIKRGLDTNIISVYRSDDGRRLMVNLNIRGNCFCLVSAYAPNVIALRIDFLKRLSKWMKQKCCDDDKLIVGADLNVVDNPIDRSSGKLDASSGHFTNLKRFVCADDTFRHTNPACREYTYIDPSGRGNLSRIDYILSSRYMTSNTKSSSILVAPVPDHKAVFAHFYSNSRPRGRGYWKLNSQFLGYDEYKYEVKSLTTDTLNEYEHILPYKTLWDLIKIRIKEYSIKFGIHLSKIRKATSSDLEKNFPI